MFDRIKAKLYSHNFLKSVLVLVSGNILGYGINVIALPIISRIYSPGQLGEYDLILSSGRFVMEIISLGLIIAIMLPENDEDSKGLCQLIGVLNFSFVTALMIVVLSISNYYKLFVTSVDYSTAVVLLGLYLISYNMQSLFYSYTNRHKKYRVLFWNPLVMSVTNVVISIILGVCGFETAGYLVGTILANVICIIHMKFHVSPFRTRPSLRVWKQLIVRYKEIVLIQLPANIVSQIGNEIPIQFLGRVFGATMLGGYSMAMRILNIPVSVLSVPVNRVVYQTMAEKVNNKENVGDFLFSILSQNIKIALVPVGILIVTGDRLVPFFLGDEWQIAGDYIPVLGMMFLLKFCSACVSGTFVVMKRQKLSLVMSFVNLAKFGFCFGCSYWLGMGVFSTIVFYAIVECIFQLLNLGLCVYCTEYSMKRFSVFVLKYILGGNVLIYVTYLLIRNCLY